MTTPPANVAWVHFASSGTTLDDPTYDTSNFGELQSTLGTTKKIGGLYRQGWEASGPAATGNDTPTGGAQRHTHGYNSVSQQGDGYGYLILDLVSGNKYRLWAASGVHWIDYTNGIQATTLAGAALSGVGETHTTPSPLAAYYNTLPGGSIMDIWGTRFDTYAAWRDGQDYFEFTATATDLRFFRGPNQELSALNAIGILDVTAPAGRKNQLTTTFVGKKV